MNLKEFISHRQYCPICETQLITNFHSNRKQTIKLEEHRFVVFFELDSLTCSQKPYAMSYSFGLEHFDFQVEFYTSDRSSRFEICHDFLIKRFLELHKNLKTFQFIRECIFCGQYKCSTQLFELNLKTSKCESLTIFSEEFGLVQPISDGHRIYRLSNNYLESKSDLTLFRGKPADAKIRYPAVRSWQNPTVLRLPLIPFISKEKTTDRLNNLMIFI